jgi:hypothetical protein
MTRWRRAFPLLLVALLVVAACSVSLAQVADAGVHVCDATKGWGPAKSEIGRSASLLLELAALPVGSIQPVPASNAWEGAPQWLAVVVDRGRVQPRAPRAPPFA